MRLVLTSAALVVLAGALPAQTQNLVFITNQNTGTVIAPSAGAIGNGLDSANTRKVVMFDLDFDGDLDAYFLNHNANSRGLKNNGAGVFTSENAGNPIYAATNGTGAKGVRAFDADGDGDLDVFIACGPVAGVQKNNIWLANLAQAAPGNTNFTNVTAFEPINFEHSYDAAFLLLGGVKTILVANRSIDGVAGSGGNRKLTETGVVGVYQNGVPANGNFNSADPAEVRNSRDLVAADFDGDGLTDVFVCNAGSGGEANQAFRQVGAALVADPVAAFLATPGNSYGASAADLDLDGLLDLVVANRLTSTSGEPNLLFENTSSLGDIDFTQHTATVIDDAVSTSYDVRLADLDLDGDADLVVANNLGNNAVYMNNNIGTGASPFSAGGFTKVVDGLIQSNRGRTRSIAVADVGNYGPDANHQGAEVAFANTIGGANTFFRGMGKQFFTLAGTATTAANAVSLDGGGFMSPSIGAGGSLVMAGGNSAGVAVLDLALTASAVPFGTGTLVAQGGITTTQFALDGTGAATVNVASASIPAVLSGLRLFVQARTDENGSAPGALDACSNGLSLVVQ